MEPEAIAGTDWSELECLAAIWIYWKMDSSRDLVKKDLYRLIAKATGRSEKSVEYKVQNVSAFDPRPRAEKPINEAPNGQKLLGDLFEEWWPKRDQLDEKVKALLPDAAGLPVPKETTFTVKAVTDDLLKLKDQPIPVLGKPKEKMVLKEISKGVVTVDGNGQNAYSSPIQHLTKFVEALATGKAVSKDQIVGQSGSYRNRVATLLANHPEVVWAKKDGRTVLIRKPDMLHPAGQLVELQDKAAIAKAEWYGGAGSSLPASAPVLQLPTTHDFDFARIQKAIQQAGLFYVPKDLYAYHLNLTCLPGKHFVILSGISGTGKSELARAYANAVYHQDPMRKDSPYFLRLEVEADWQSVRPLLGYFNHLTGHYERKPFLDFMIEADRHARQAEKEGKQLPPFFLCLDEMNIARVEYYFSRLLSAMESGDVVRLHGGEVDEEEDVPAEIHYPRNLFLTATINTDESTFGVSDKVLDRAFTMDLSTVLLLQYQEALKNQASDAAQKDIIDKVFLHLVPLQEILSPKRFHMGYRTIKEIVAFVVRSQAEKGLLSVEQAIDLALAEKGLPKLRGDDRLIPTLDKLIIELTKLGPDSECLKRVTEMKDEVVNYGMSQFGR